MREARAGRPTVTELLNNVNDNVARVRELLESRAPGQAGDDGGGGGGDEIMMLQMVTTLLSQTGDRLERLLCLATVVREETLSECQETCQALPQGLRMRLA